MSEGERHKPPRSGTAKGGSGSSTHPRGGALERVAGPAALDEAPPEPRHVGRDVGALSREQPAARVGHPRPRELPQVEQLPDDDRVAEHVDRGGVVRVRATHRARALPHDLGRPPVRRTVARGAHPEPPAEACCEPEVGQLRVEPRGDQHVARREVDLREPVRVEVCHPARDLQRELLAVCSKRGGERRQQAQSGGVLAARAHTPCPVQQVEERPVGTELGDDGAGVVRRVVGEPVKPDDVAVWREQAARVWHTWRGESTGMAQVESGKALAFGGAEPM